MSALHASVIIPTYNRPSQLANLLDSLAAQSIAPSSFEVIVVDDGSEAGYSDTIERPWPFRLCYLRQENTGEAFARNHGVERAGSDFIIFIDDDMTVVPEYIDALVMEHQAHPNTLILGNMFVPPEVNGSVFQRTVSLSTPDNKIGPVLFTDMAAGVLAMPRAVYRQLGGMKPVPDPQRGAWMDLAFAYQAQLAGYKFRRCGSAIAHHHDFTVASRQATAKRMYNISRLAPALFADIPGLEPNVAMYRDMGPVNWRRDSLSLIARKVARSAISNGLSMRILEWVSERLEAHYPRPELLGPLYRWMMGGYIYHGYRQGLKELAHEV